MKSESFDLKKTRLTCACLVFFSVGDLTCELFRNACGSCAQSTAEDFLKMVVKKDRNM